MSLSHTISTTASYSIDSAQGKVSFHRNYSFPQQDWLMIFARTTGINNTEYLLWKLQQLCQSRTFLYRMYLVFPSVGSYTFTMIRAVIFTVSDIMGFPKGNFICQVTHAYVCAWNFSFFKKIQNMLTIINFLPGNAGIMYRYTGHVGVPAINFTLCREQCV